MGQTEVGSWSNARDTGGSIEVGFCSWAVCELRVGCLVVDIVVPPLIVRQSSKDQIGRFEVGLSLLDNDTAVKRAAVGGK